MTKKHQPSIRFQ